jgi:hypothetical protein
MASRDCKTPSPHERAAGIEPASPPRQGGALPVSYTRVPFPPVREGHRADGKSVPASSDLWSGVSADPQGSPQGGQ